MNRGRWSIGASLTLVCSLAGVCGAEHPTGWGGGGPASGYGFEKDTDHKHAGTASAVLKSAADNSPTSPGAFIQVVRADKYRGKRLRFKAFVKSEAIENKGGLWMRIDTSDNFGVEYSNTQRDHAVTGTTDWKELELVLDVPADGRIVSFGGTLTGKGKLWVDDVTLEIVTADVATTAFPVRPQPKTKKGPVTAPEDLVNAGFEDSIAH